MKYTNLTLKSVNEVSRFPSDFTPDEDYCSSLHQSTGGEWSGQRQLQDETRIVLILGFSAHYIRDFTVFIYSVLWMMMGWFLGGQDTSSRNTDQQRMVYPGAVAQ